MRNCISIVLLFASAQVSMATTAYISVLKTETCGNANGELRAGLSGTPIFGPLSYLWSTGGTTATLTGLVAGNYSVTITDAQGTPFTANTVLSNVNSLPTAGQEPSFGSDPYDLLGYTGGACEGQCNGVLGMPMGELGGTAPFSYTFDVPNSYIGTSSFGHPVYSGFCGAALVNYTMTDALGCTGAGSFNVVNIDATWGPNIGIIEGACAGSDIGSVQLISFSSVSNVVTLFDNGGPLAGPIFLDASQTALIPNLPAGGYDLISVPGSSQCSILTNVQIPDLGPGCTSVSGTSWYDANGDCVLDAGEVGIPGSVLLIQPGNQFAITGSTGQFGFNLPTGNYTLAQTDASLVPFCPAIVPVPFTISGTPTVIDLANNSTAPLDLLLHATSSPARSGFAHILYASVVDHTPQVSGPVTVTCTFDPALNYVMGYPTPTSVVGNTITWVLPAFGYFGNTALSVQLDVPASTLIGTALTHTFNVSNTLPEGDLTNNSITVMRTVTAAYDPNEKTARTSTQASNNVYYIDADEWIDYTIRFQNTGTDTAFTVVLADTLAAELDMASFQPGTASHACAVSFKPGRVIEWRLGNINLPDSNTNEAESHGSVSFRIKPLLPLVPGTTIANTANIFFDYNDPVITEPSVLTAEFSTGIVEQRSDVKLFPNPATNSIALSGMPNARWTLTALDGRRLASGKFITEPGSVDVTSLSDGMYLITLSTAQGQRTIPFQKLSQQ